MDNPYGTIQTYRNAIAIKKHNAIIESWASPMALDVAAIFWATWKGIETRLPSGNEVIEAEKPRDSRDLKNKYSAIIRVEVKRHSDELQKTLAKYIKNVHLAGAVEQSRDLGCTAWYFSSLSKSSTSREAIRTPDGVSLQEAAEWVSLPNTLAQQYANKRAAEAVTQINDTTRKSIADIVSNGVATGSSYDDIAKAIKTKFEEFAVPKPQAHIPNRAVLVAVTELANAYCEGNAQVGTFLQDSGVKMMKAWQSLEDSRVSAGCRENERVGWIPIDKEFPSGHKHPPRFPGCRCDFLQDILEEDMLGKPIEALYGKQYAKPKSNADIPEDNLSIGAKNMMYRSPGDMFSDFKKKYSEDMSSQVSNALDIVFKDMESNPRVGWGITPGGRQVHIPKVKSLFDYGGLLKDHTGANVRETLVNAVKDKLLPKRDAGRMLLLDEYCGTGKYAGLNKYLRGQRLTKDEKRYLPDQDVIELMVDSMKDENLERGFTATRYLRSTPASFKESLKVDNTYSDKGFVSLSTKENHTFSDYADVIMHVTVPPGRGRGVYTQALETLYPNNYGIPKDGFSDEESQGEHEFVLTPESRFRVTKVEDNKVNGPKVKEVWVEVYDE